MASRLSGREPQWFGADLGHEVDIVPVVFHSNVQGQGRCAAFFAQRPLH